MSVRENDPIYTPACDFMPGELVWFPVVLGRGRVGMGRGRVHRVMDSEFVVTRGNAVNMVVERKGVLYPVHSNCVSKTRSKL